jgi:ureidoglycolate lyase
MEPWTDEAFEPFGFVLRGTSPPAFESGTLQTWTSPFEVDDQVLVTLCRYHREPVRFSRLERHFAVTQAFLPLGGCRSVMVVAPATATGAPSDVPDPASIRAFELPGDAGVVLKRGTWHALRRYPLDASYVDFVLLTSAATQAEIEAMASAGTPPERLTQEVDYLERDQLCFEVRGFA